MMPRRTALYSVNTFFIPAILMAAVLGLCGCSAIVSSATSDMMAHLSRSVSDNNDLALVEDGAPAFLLMIDSLILKDPGNEKTLVSAANLYTTYAGLFVTDKDRASKMAAKALDYAGRALCLSDEKACGLKGRPFDQARPLVLQMDKDQVPALFALGSAWARWIMANRDDFNAIADLAHIELIMQQVARLEPGYRDGAAFIYLGTLSCLLPPSLGGKPEQGRQYFEQSLALAGKQSLTAKVMFAQFYARITFNRELHDRLLTDVLAADPHVEGHTLANTWAQAKARQLMDSADDYF